MLVFEQEKVHQLVSYLQEEMGKADFVEKQKEILKKLPVDFDTASPAIFYTQGEDYLETVDVVEAVKSAKDRFVMFELGAGYGRWCITAFYASMFLNPLPCHFVAVEAEKTHFRFLKAYFAAHGLNLEDHLLIEAAIDVNPGHAVFHMGDSNQWYGQYIAKEKPNLFNSWYYAVQNKLFNLLGMKNVKYKEIVRTVTLNSLLQQYEKVDLIDMDIQGCELRVLEASIDLLNRKVKRLHIGTHGPEIDEGLHKLFSKHGWKNIHLFSTFSKCMTPYGFVEFNDGIQSWVNPRID